MGNDVRSSLVSGSLVDGVNPSDLLTGVCADVDDSNESDCVGGGDVDTESVILEVSAIGFRKRGGDNV